ncbi:hypothetical protein I5Q34_13500 [Streptomyces sp. AV19]|uniref:hypothetical protein n=1 Tax=Streptomyces sp. AV19 TaxID=2793068 RepID=UPI0018FE7AA0|nr:hypothetical protein [Streptomyces sp. AV19]MBH1935275.1 hypothetical protein [Streptomyces sp. AV19]MDG4531162.1 hypothetical protein [Streptomyces sp. AV19]
MPLPEQIKPGDVVLSRGTEALSRAICLMDDSEVSHAALAVGEEGLAEVTGKGLHTLSFARAQEGHDLVVGRTLAAPADMTPVLDVARRYLDAGRTSYAYQQIVLLAVLCVTRRVPLPPGGRLLARTALDRAAAALNAMAEMGRQPMICSEFVYRCHYEAIPGDPYVLKTDGGGVRGAAEGQSLLDWAEAHPALPRVQALPKTGPFDPAATEAAVAPLVSACTAAAGRLPLGGHLPTDPDDEELLASMAAFGRALHGGPLPAGQALEAIRAKEAEPNFVTPGDLLRSLSLKETLRLGHASRGGLF